MTGTLIPWITQQFFIGDVPAAGYQLFTYQAGTSTKLATYSDSETSVAQTNPIILDANGQPESTIFLQPLSYKFVLAPPDDTDPPIAAVDSWDNISAIPPINVDLDVSGTGGEAIAPNEWVYLSDGTGGKTAGRWYLTDQDNDYASVLPVNVGVALSGSTAGTAITVRLAGRLTGTSGLTTGSKYYLSATAGAITSTAPSNPRRVAQADSTTSALVCPMIVEPIKGFIPLDLLSARLMSGASIFPAVVNVGGLLASDTAPSIQRVNAATDQAVRVRWAATVVIELQLPTFAYPPDLDDAAAVEVHLLAAMSATNDAPVIAVRYFEGLGDTNAGGNTAAVTGATIAEYTVTIAAADVGAHPTFASIGLIPAAHGTDELRLYAAWVEYTKKLKAS